MQGLLVSCTKALRHAYFVAAEVSKCGAGNSGVRVAVDGVLGVNVSVNGSANVAFGFVPWPDLAQMLARCSSAPGSARLARPWPDHGPDAGQPWLELGQTPTCPSVHT